MCTPMPALVTIMTQWNEYLHTLAVYIYIARERFIWMCTYMMLMVHRISLCHFCG